MAITRRDILKGLAGSTVTTIIGGSMSITNPVQANELQTASKAQTLAGKKLTTDVLVAGGGLAGVCAAISAARNNASVILVQDRSRLGGNSSSEIRMHALGANNPKELREWRETGLIEEFKLTDSATNPQRSFEMWDLMLYDKVVSEKNITLLLDTAVISSTATDNQITKAEAISPLLEARYEIEAKFFIDCTGDGLLAAAAGAEYMRGREGQNIFKESLAPAKSDLKTMGNSILFFASKHLQPMPFTAPSWARKFTTADFKHRRIHSWEYGYWWIEWGGELDTIADNRRIRHELLRVVMGVWDFIKNSRQHPDSANWALDWVGMIPGKRESRRILGEHVIIQAELEQAERFPDRVAYGGWPMDDHPPAGIDGKNLKPCRQIYFKQPYHIPFRSLYSKNRKNLLMAGRNISASHVAFSSTRVMATCATMGQAVGTAAALCLQSKLFPREIAANSQRLQNFQQLLLKNDQALLEIQNQDPLDFARQAAVTASSETESGKALKIIDGWNRATGNGDLHQWQALMTSGAPWIQLEWSHPQQIQFIQVTFDSGLHRLLFLSGEDGVYLPQTRGKQPETVSDYRIEAEIEGAFKEIAKGKDNYLRLVRHKIEPNVLTQKIRIEILKTNGDPLARVFEVRCYS